MIERRLAKNLISYRKLLKMSQSDLARKSHVSTANIGYIENMRNSPSVEVVEKLAVAMEIDVCLLIARPEIQFPGTGIKKQSLNPYLLHEGEASFAF